MSTHRPHLSTKIGFESAASIAWIAPAESLGYCRSLLVIDAVVWTQAPGAGPSSPATPASPAVDRDGRIARLESLGGKATIALAETIR
jgi:hypothetical protein